MEDFILKLVRESIESFVKTGKKIPVPENYPEELNEKRGVFVTIYKKPNKLRGCIGFPYPQIPLIQGLIEASSAACRDPRFKPLKEKELHDIFIEVSVLTEPELIKVENPREYLDKIKIGIDGLIIKRGIHSGLLLPQVPVELGWRTEDFLENLCMKAGLTIDSWLDSHSQIYKFEARVIKEKL